MPEKTQKKLNFNIIKNKDVLWSLQTPDGKTFGDVSYDAYKAVQKGQIDKYTPKNNSEKKIIKEYRNHPGFALITNTGVNLGNVTYDGYKAFTENKIDTYTPNKYEANTFKKYQDFVNVQSVDIPLADGSALHMTYGTISKIDDFFERNKQNANARDDINNLIDSLGLQGVDRENAKAYAEIRKNELPEKQKKKDNFFQWAGKQFMGGLSQFNKNLTSTLDYFMPTDFLGKYDPFKNLDNYYTGLRDEYVTAANESSKALGGGWVTAGELLQGAVTAAPDMVLAYMTAGGSVGASAGTKSLQTASALGNAAVKGTVKSTVASVVNTTMKNPTYWSSFLQTVGTDYEEAKANGANEFVATSSAMLTSLLNAGVETGGMQALPGKVKRGGKQAVIDWVKSSLEEGQEEVVQSIITQSVAKLMYDKDKEVLSLTDENAILNPGRAAKEFGMGAGVGAILGGGAKSIETLWNRTKISRTGKKLISDISEKEKKETVEDLIASGLESPENTEAYKLAEKAQQKLQKKGKLSNADIGKLYLENREQMKKEDAELEEIAVGDKFKDKKTGKTLTVVERDAENTVVEMEDGTTKTMPNANIDNFAESEQAERIESESGIENTIDEEILESKGNDVDAVVETTPEAPAEVDARNTFTGELDEMRSTEMPSVSVGDAFIDTKSNNALKIVERNDTTTTIEVTTPKGEKKVITQTNKIADTFVVDDRYKKVEFSATNTQNNTNVETTDVKTPQKADVVTTNVNKTATSTNTENMHDTEATDTDDVVDESDAQVTEIVDAIDETIIPGDKEKLIAVLAKGGHRADTITIAKSLRKAYKNTGTLGKMADFFTDKGAKVVSAIKGTIDTTTTETVAKDVKTETAKPESEKTADTKTKPTPKNVTMAKDGYEVYGEDAILLAEELNLTPTKKVINGIETDVLIVPETLLDEGVEDDNFASNELRASLSSMGSAFFGNEKVTAEEFEAMLEDGSYKEHQGYKDYVKSIVNVYTQSRGITKLSESNKAEIERQIEGVIRVGIAAKKAGYDIFDDGEARDIKDSKKRLLFSSLEPNSDYITSSDISTICDKRKNFAEIYDAIVKLEESRGVPADKRFFSNVDNYFILHKLMADKGLTIPCEECYVESMRKNLAPMANAFLELVTETDSKNKTNAQLYHQDGKDKGNVKKNNAKLRASVRGMYDSVTGSEIVKNHSPISVDNLTIEMLTTADGLAQLKLQAPYLYEAFNSFYGQSKPKMPKQATPFRPGELIALMTDSKGKIKKGLVDKIVSTGGFRLQSYSDFQIENFTDVLQTIFEASMLGLNGHAYTKVPAFLEATKGTNLKRNISIFMYEDNGQWVLDKKNSFPMELNDIYALVASDESGNTSIIAVSQNEDMSAWIMANDNVGYGIPFHKSGLKMDVVRARVVKTPDGREVLGYQNQKDHTAQQSEVWKKTLSEKKKINTKVKQPIDIYKFWDFENKDNLSKKELIEKNIKKYIDECNKRNYRPKFREYVMNNESILDNVLRYAKELGFVSQDATIDDISFEYDEYRIPYGYYKFLGDFGMFKADGTATPIETLSLENYDFDGAVEFFKDSEKLRTNELLQQFENGQVREQYRKMIENGDLTIEQLSDILKEKREAVATSVVDGFTEQRTSNKGVNRDVDNGRTQEENSAKRTVDTSREIPENGNRFGETSSERKTDTIPKSRNSIHSKQPRATQFTKRGHTEIGRRTVETKTIDDILEDESFVNVKYRVRQELSSVQHKELYEKYKNDDRIVEGYDFDEVYAYDMLANSDNELREIFADEIAEYFNNDFDIAKDITGREVSADILKATKKSVVKNKHGQLIPVYHGTNKDFLLFEIGDIGFHFGSYAQALKIIADKEFDTPKVKRAYLNIQNPLIIDDDRGGWNASQIAQIMAERGIISREEGLKFLMAETKEADNKRMVEILREHNYDGIIYTNSYEADEGTAYIVFDNSQVFVTETTDVAKDESGFRYSIDSYAPTFYSHMAKTIDGMKDGKYGANSVVSYLKGKGVKNEEIKWSGIEEFLEGKKSVTKAELQEFVAGSMLQIEETTLDDNEIPYTEEQTAKIAEYEDERNKIFEELKREWKKALGTEYPMQHFGLGLESSVVNLLSETNRQIKESNSGHEYESAKEQLLDMFEEEDFGFDSAYEAFREAARYPDEFMEGYDLTDEQKAILERFVSAKETFKKSEGIPIETQKHLRSIAAKSDDIGRKISRIKTEHNKESDKHKPKWKAYSLNGGENYREIIFKLPNSTYSNGAMVGHWNGTVTNAEGILAHTRVQDFEVDGKKMLFIEEIQSDWHNEGHKEGYLDKDSVYEIRLENHPTSKESDGTPKKVYRLYKDGQSTYHFMWEESAKDFNDETDEWVTAPESEILEQLIEYDKVDTSAVPDAPFRDNYHEYVLKNILRMAAEQGYDLIGWTPSEIQSERWSEEFAEGYKIEYDQDIPKFLNKYGKKWGAKVGVTTLENNDNTKVWSMPITDEMKDSVLYEGQALYSLEREGKNNEQRKGLRTDLLSENSGWGHNEDSRKQTERVLSFKRKNQGRNETERKNFTKELLEQGQTDEIIEGKNKYTRIKPEAYNDDMLSIVEEAKKHGKEVEFFVGHAQIKFDNSRRYLVNGIKTSDSKILIQYDDVLPPQVIFLHEFGHSEWKTPEMQKVKDTILNSLSETDKKNILSQERYKRYMQVYKGNMDIVWEEFVADTLSGMNEYTERFIDTVYDYWYGNETVEGYNPATYAESIDAGGNQIDTEYLKAVESGDMETAQKMVEEYAKKSGYTVNAYHGTTSKFNVFDKSKQGSKNGSVLGNAFYFASDESVADEWGGRDKTMSVFLKLQNPINVDSAITEDMLSAYQALPGKDINELEDFYNSYMKKSYPTFEDYLKVYEENSKRIAEIDTKSVGSWIGAMNTKGDSNNNSTNLLKGFGIDGIISEHKRSRNFPDWTEYAVFDENQIKSADTIVYDDDGNIIPLSERFNSENDDIRWSLEGDDIPEIDELWDAYVELYGAIPKGEKPTRDINVPKKVSKKDVVSHFARTMLEAGVTPDWAVSEFEKAIVEGDMTHEVITNKKARQKAIDTIKKLGFKDALNRWSVLSDSEKIGKNELALGMELYNQCITNKDVTNAMKLASELAAEATRAGQTLQACRMLKLMTPDGQLYYLEKSIQKMNEEFKDKLGDKFKDIELDKSLMEEFFTEKDEAKRNAAYDKICQNIADQIPATLKDKWNSWRYLAMLGNTRTHIRNILGNAVFVPSIKLKNYIGAVIESAIGLNSSERTKSFSKSKEAIEFAKKDFTKMEKVLQGENAKYAVTSDIESKRTIFKTKILEKARLKNFEFLEKEDIFFLKMHYIDALARLLTVRNIDIKTMDAKTLDKARAYAVKEAQAATYRDANALAEGLNKLQRNLERSDKKAIRAAGVLVEGVMPFKKTPLNIAKQGINYSPIGILKGTYNALTNLKDGNATVDEVIDDFAKGLTGTGMMLLGYFLASLGILSGVGDEPDKEKKFNKMVGEQNYSINIGNWSYTIDWATPSNLSLFIGANLFDIAEGDFKFADVVTALSTITEPLLELSVFDGVNGVIESAQYSDSSPIVTIMSDMATSYFMQALPTIGGQLNRLMDDNKREYYYIDKNKNIPKGLQRIIGQASSKIPFVSYLFEPAIDEWGREQKYGNTLERVFENTVSPGYYAEKNYTDVDEELKSLYERTGEISVLPTTQTKYFTQDSKRYNLTAKEYTEAKKIRGKKSFELANMVINDNAMVKLQNKETGKYEMKIYSDMSDDEKVRALEKCYKAAGDYTKEEMLKKIKKDTKSK